MFRKIDRGNAISRNSGKILFLCSFLILFFFSSCVSLAGQSLPENKNISASTVWEEPNTHMKFVRIPKGCFTMGSPLDERGRDTDEGPTHEVCVHGFWIGITEVTVGQFEKFVQDSKYKTEAEREGFSWIYTNKWEKKEGYNWRNAGFPQTKDSPVVNVSWNDARAMAKWLSDKTGKTFRLPTEAEWEYACRGGTPYSRFWGDDPNEACEYANVADKTAKKPFPAWEIHECVDGYVFTAPVRHFKPNQFGLFDMLGNVWEWCEDRYNPESYAKHKKYNPLYQGNDSQGIVIRGGSWYSRPRYVRCASRDHLYTSHRRGSDIGFRLVIIP